MFGNKVIREREHDIVPRQGGVHEPLPAAVAACACGHRIEDHDAVGRRYCAATINAVLPRGCICGITPADDQRRGVAPCGR